MPDLPAWHYANTLADPHLASPSVGGAYLFVFDGPPRRVVYVGTARVFSDRLGDHRKAFAAGKRTMWRPGGGDVYRLLSAAAKDYEALATAGIVWVPGDKKPGRDHFDTQDWSEWSGDVESYLARLHVWTCVMSNETALHLESALQITLAERFKLGYYRGGQSWLGKLERSGAQRDVWTCPRWPIVELETAGVFRSLEVREVPPLTGGDRGR